MPHRIHCILIDDDPAVLSPMQNILHQSAQFHVDKCFTSIDNALAYLQTHQPDLIISDIEFPQQDLAYYRLKEFPDDIPLCLISGYPVYVAQSYPFLRDKASTIGILTKPFTPALMQVLETLYNQYKQRQERQQQDSYQTEQLIRAANEHKLKLFKLKDNQSIVPVGIPIANIINHGIPQPNLPWIDRILPLFPQTFCPAQHHAQGMLRRHRKPLPGTLHPNWAKRHCQPFERDYRM